MRVVALTKEGEKVISPVYHRHAVLLEHIFEPRSENQRLSLENMLKLLGSRGPRAWDQTVEELDTGGAIRRDRSYSD